MARTRAAAERRVSPELVAVLRDQQAALPASRARAPQPGGARRRRHRGGGDRPAGRSFPGPALRLLQGGVRDRRGAGAGGGVGRPLRAALLAADRRPRLRRDRLGDGRRRRRRAGQAVAPRRAAGGGARLDRAPPAPVGGRRAARHARRAAGRRAGRQGDAGPPARPLHRRAPDRAGVRRRPRPSCSPTRVSSSSTRARRASPRSRRPSTAKRSTPVRRSDSASTSGAPRSRRRASSSRSPMRPGCALVFGHRRCRDRPSVSAGTAPRGLGVVHPVRPWRGRRRRGLLRPGDRRRAGPRSAPLLDLRPAAADRAGHAAADGGLRRRPGGGELLRPDGAALRTL